jgi:hypothetical protein
VAGPVADPEAVPLGESPLVAVAAPEAVAVRPWASLVPGARLVIDGREREGK